MTPFEKVSVSFILVIFQYVSLTVQHPTTIESTVDINKELKSIKTDISLLYKKLSELSASAGPKGKKNITRSTLKDHRICFTKPCIDSAYQLLKNMDLEVDPCQDFYKFSCGNYIKETIIPDDKKKWTSFSPLEEISKYRLNTKFITDEENFN